MVLLGSGTPYWCDLPVEYPTGVISQWNMVLVFLASRTPHGAISQWNTLLVFLVSGTPYWCY